MEEEKKTSKTVDIQTLSAIVARMTLASKLGTQQYGGDRDIYRALGYLEDITFTDYYGRYLRQDIAKAIIDRPVSVTWRGAVLLMEAGVKEDTALEKAWKELDRSMGLKSRLARLDRLTGLGKYGVLMLGLNDVSTIEDFKTPVTGKGKKLLYVKPLSSESAKIATYETDPNNERYGLPILYDVVTQEVESGGTKSIQLHYTRLIHIVDDILESEVEGSPRLEVVFNRLMDLEKLVGGDAEMFWRGARPGYTGKLEKDYQITDDTMTALQTQIDEYEHNLRRMLINEGIDLQSLAQQVADPSTHVDIQIQMISAVTGIPKRILTGSERGELASSQDKSEWLEYVQGRREEYAEPRIIRPLVDRLIELGILPAAGAEGYTVQWADLFAQSEEDKVKIGGMRSTALASYSNNPTAQAIVSPEAFMEFFLGFDEDQIDQVNELRDSEISQEIQETREEEQARKDEMALKLIQAKTPAVQPGQKPVPQQIVKKKKPVTHIEDYGGEGSGHFDHAGRPGKVGGSADEDGTKESASKKKEFKDTDLQKTHELLNQPEVLNKINIPDKMYHVTQKENAESIRKNGLTLDAGKGIDEIGETAGRLYLSNDPYGILDSTDMNSDDVVLVEVDMKGFKSNFNLDPEYYTDKKVDEVINRANGQPGNWDTGLYIFVKESIPASRIKVKSF